MAAASASPTPAGTVAFAFQIGGPSTITDSLQAAVVERVRKQTQSQGKRLEKLQREREAANAHSASRAQELEQLKRRNQELQATVDKLSADLAAKDVESTSLRRRVEELLDRIGQLEDSLASAQALAVSQEALRIATQTSQDLQQTNARLLAEARAREDSLVMRQMMYDLEERLLLQVGDGNLTTVSKLIKFARKNPAAPQAQVWHQFVRRYQLDMRHIDLMLHFISSGVGTAHPTDAVPPQTVPAARDIARRLLDAQFPPGAAVRFELRDIVRDYAFANALVDAWYGLSTGAAAPLPLAPAP